MPSVLLTESMQVELGGHDPWPPDVKLFQPYEVEQILMPDNANTLAVQAFLKMCDLPFQVEHRSNAEFMSPSGRLPFIKCGQFVVSELDPIIAFVNNKGISLTSNLDSSQKADMRAYMSLVNTVLVNAELYVCWCDSVTRKEVTNSRYGSVFPWPLNHVLTYQKKNQVNRRLGILGWSNKSLQEVYKEVDSCCAALSERLDSKQYFFGDKPTDLDAVVYGHLYTLLKTCPPDVDLHVIVEDYDDLVDLVKRIDKKYFPDREAAPQADEETPKKGGGDEEEEEEKEEEEEEEKEEEKEGKEEEEEEGAPKEDEGTTHEDEAKQEEAAPEDEEDEDEEDDDEEDEEEEKS